MHWFDTAIVADSILYLIVVTAVRSDVHVAWSKTVPELCSNSPLSGETTPPPTPPLHTNRVHNDVYHSHMFIKYGLMVKQYFKNNVSLNS